jgi:DNA-directed RNA polymerase specialized sigma24 family protein
LKHYPGNIKHKEGVPNEPNPQNSPADKAFPDHTELELYERLFWNTFSRLTETSRKILLLHWEDCSIHEISEILSLSEAFVEKWKLLSTQIFIEAVKRHEDYDQLHRPHQ